MCVCVKGRRDTHFSLLLFKEMMLRFMFCIFPLPLAPAFICGGVVNDERILRGDVLVFEKVSEVK